MRTALAVVLVSAIVAGCASSGQSAGAPAASETASSRPTPSGPSLIEQLGIEFEASNELQPIGVLDVYRPERRGPWPVVVMFHGDPSSASKGWLSGHARAVAALGFVAFVPTWGKPGGDAYAALTRAGQLHASASQAACAVEFARAHAAEYEGDASTLILFGHSAGGNMAAQIAFARPQPPQDCLGSTSLGDIDTLITWEGDWLLGDPSWDPVLAADPEPINEITPWKHLADQPDLRVLMVVGENTLSRPMPDQAAVDAFLAVRDLDGTLRGRLAAMGAFDDGVFGLAEEQTLLFNVLKDQGNPVTLDVMPGSTHESLSAEGREVFLAAFEQAASAD